MATPTEPTSITSQPGLPAQQVYVMSGICLLLGLLVGYFWIGKGAASNIPPGQPAAASAPAALPGGHPKLTLEQMKQMAGVQTSALIEKSKADPQNAGLLVQIAGVYQSTHQFKEAADYYQKALKLDPKNVPARTQLASCLYYGGDADSAIAQLNQALKYNPKDANTLFNLGMIKYRGKSDPAGAIAAWQELLKTNPDLDRKPDVERLIAEAKAGAGPKN